MKTYLIAFFCLLSAYASAQATYNPAYTPLFTVASKPYAISQAAPVDGRTYKADSINFLWRPYNGTNEVLSYLNLAKYRTGQFPIEVNIGGTLNNNGTFTGGYIYECWFRNGTADSNLVLKSYWPTSTSGFLQAANNLSDVVSASTSRTNLGLGSMATQSTTAGGDLSGTWPTVTVAQFNGELPSYYLNYNNLNNKPTIPAQFNPIQGVNMSITGTYPNMTFSAVVDVSPTLAQVVYAGNTTDTTIFDYDSLYGEQVAAHGTLYVGDSATYAPRPTQDTIIGFGNSIMEGTAATDGLSFFFQYCNYVNAFGLDSGQSGTFLSDFNVNNVPAWTAHHKVMLLYETNDYYGGSITLPNYLTEYVGKIDSLETQKGFPDTSIITLFCPLSDTTEGGLTPFGMETWVNSLDSMAQVMGIPHVDLWHYMYDNGAFTLNYPTSLLHPSQSGHNVIAQAILLQLTKGSGDVKRPLFVRSIKSGQQIVLDAPTILSTGDKIRESNNLPRSASSDLLTSSVSGTDVRSEIRGGMTTSDASAALMAAENQGVNIPTGIGAYTLTDTTGIPQAGGYGWMIQANPQQNGITYFYTFSGLDENSNGGPIIISPTKFHGITLFNDGNISFGSAADLANTVYSSIPVVLQGAFSPEVLGAPGPVDRLTSSNDGGQLDTINGYNVDTAAFLFQYEDATPFFKHIYPSTIGAASAFAGTNTQVAYANSSNNLAGDSLFTRQSITGNKGIVIGSQTFTLPYSYMVNNQFETVDPGSANAGFNPGLFFATGGSGANTQFIKASTSNSIIAGEVLTIPVTPNQKDTLEYMGDSLTSNPAAKVTQAQFHPTSAVFSSGTSVSLVPGLFNVINAATITTLVFPAGTYDGQVIEAKIVVSGITSLTNSGSTATPWIVTTQGENAKWVWSSAASVWY